MNRKIVSLFLALLMLLSVIPASAAVTGSNDCTKSGIIYSEDFSGYGGMTNAQINALTSWADSWGWSITDGAWTPGTGGASALIDIDPDNTLADGNIDSGLIMFSFDAKISRRPEGETDDVIAFVRHSNGGTDAYGNIAMNGCFASVCVQGGQPLIAFNPQSATYAFTDGRVNYKHISADTWTNIKVFIDYDNKAADYYVNGEKVCTYAGLGIGGPDEFHGLFDFSMLELKDWGKTTGAQFDNICVARLNNNKITAKINDIGTSSVSIGFNTVIEDNGTFIPENFRLRNLADGTAKAARTVTVKADGVDIDFGGAFAADSDFEIIIKADVEEKFTGLKMSSTNLFFSTNKKQISLLNQDFSISEIDTTAEAPFYYVGKKDGDSSGDFIAQPERSKTLMSKADKEGGGKLDILQVVHADMYPGTTHWKNIVFPFENGLSASSGKLTFEFDMAFAGYPYMDRWDISFGLHDKNNEVTEFEQNTNQANATIFAGTAYNGNGAGNKALSYGLKNAQGKIATRYYAKDTWKTSPGDGIIDLTNDYEVNSDWRSEYCLVYNMQAAANGGNAAMQAAMHHYKVAVDIDNNSFEVWFDGVLKKTVNYIPGNKTGGDYDALVFALVGETQGCIPKGDMTVYPGVAQFDNIAVAQELSEPSVKSAEFVTADGKTLPYGSKAPYNAAAMKIKMADNVSEASSTAGEVSIDGKNVTVTFDSLDIGKEYTVTIDGKTLVFKAVAPDYTVSGGEMTINGVTVDADNFFVMEDDEIVLEAAISMDFPAKAKLIIAMYDENGALISIYSDTVTAEASKWRLAYTATADDEDAASIKGFILDNSNNLTPLASANILPTE